MDTFLSHYAKYWIADFVWNHIMFDVRLNADIKHTSGNNLESPSLIRRSQKVWDPPKNGPIAPMPRNKSVYFWIWNSLQSGLFMEWSSMKIPLA